MGIYYFKHYRRTSRGATTGELLKRTAIEAPGLAYAQQIAAREYLPEVDFEWDFAILEGDTDFATCWLTMPLSNN